MLGGREESTGDTEKPVPLGFSCARWQRREDRSECGLVVVLPVGRLTVWERVQDALAGERLWKCELFTAFPVRGAGEQFLSLRDVSLRLLD